MHNPTPTYAIDWSPIGLTPGRTVRWPVTLFAVVGLVVTAVVVVLSRGAL